jgi:hypothetical protein
MGILTIRASSKMYGGLKSRTHPAYRPDLAPNHFFFFGYINGKLFVYNYESGEDLLNAITEIVTGVDQEVLPSVFESWINRLECVNNHDGKRCSKSRRIRDISSRLAEKTGEHKLMDRLYD